MEQAPVEQRIDFSFKLLQTTFRVVYADITTLQADVLISSDDVRLSMAGGVAAALRRAAGDGPRDDARKHALPLTVGDVLVTGAGKLPAKYLFHAITIDFNLESKPEATVATLMRRVMGLVAALQIKSIAVPLLGAGTVGLSEAAALELVLRGIACHLVHDDSPLETVTVAVYQGHASDHEAAERDLYGQTEAIRADVARWCEGAAPLNQRVSLCRGIVRTLPERSDLRGTLDRQVAADLKRFGQILDCPGAARIAQQTAEVPRTQAEYERLKRRLDMLVEDLRQELQDTEALKRAARRRKGILERRKAQQGYDTPPEVETELEEIARDLADYGRRQDHARQQLDSAREELQTLVEQWARQR